MLWVSTPNRNTEVEIKEILPEDEMRSIVVGPRENPGSKEGSSIRQITGS